MLKTRIQICIIYSISYLLTIKVKSDYRKNTVSDRFHPYFGPLLSFWSSQIESLTSSAARTHPPRDPTTKGSPSSHGIVTRANPNLPRAISAMDLTCELTERPDRTHGGAPAPRSKLDRFEHRTRQIKGTGGTS
jgi:hypothetical protein